MAGVTENGFVVKTEADIIADLNASFLAAFGAQFATDPSLPDGQVIGIYAGNLANAWLQAEAAYNAFSPTAAFDVGLDKVVELNGVVRIVDKPTRVALVFTGADGTTVPSGYSVTTDDGLSFTTVAEAILPASVSADCTTLGAISIGANEVHNLSTPIPAGLTGATNPDAGVTGIVREEDPALRQRRSKSTIASGTSALDSIYEAVESLQLPYINILENDTAVTKDGIPPFSFLTVVEGGTAEEVSRAIFENKPINIQSYGAIVTQVYDKKGRPHNIGISRPVVVYVDVIVHIKKLPGASLAADLFVKDKVVEFINATQIAYSLYWSDVIGAASNATPNTKIVSLTMRTGSDAYAMAGIPITEQQRALTEVARVVVIVD